VHEVCLTQQTDRSKKRTRADLSEQLAGAEQVQLSAGEASGSRPLYQKIPMRETGDLP
jgi:hypothetical protein